MRNLPKGVQQTWTTSSRTRAAGGCAILCNLIAVAFAVTGAGHAGVALASGLLCLGVAALIYLLTFVPYLKATQDRLVIRNPFQVSDILWSNIEDFRPGYWGIVVMKKDGSSVTAMAVQKANASVWLGVETRADDVVDVLKQRRRAALNSQG